MHCTLLSSSALVLQLILRTVCITWASIVINTLFSYLKILCTNIPCCDSSEKPVVARNMSPGLLASAVSTLLLMHNHWTTASRHSLAKVCRHVTEELCHLCSIYSLQCAVGIGDCGFPIHQILLSSIFRPNSRWKGFVWSVAYMCFLREMVWWIELNFLDLLPKYLPLYSGIWTSFEWVWCKTFQTLLRYTTTH